MTSNGACGALDVLIASLLGDPVGALAFVKDVNESDSESPFFMWIDSYDGLPAILTGGQFKIIWPTDSNKIFRL